MTNDLKSVFLKTNVYLTIGVWSKNFEKLSLLINSGIFFANFWINPICQVRSYKKLTLAVFNLSDMAG